MLKDNLEKTREFLLRHTGSRGLRRLIRRTSSRLIRVVGIFTVASAVITFAATGSDFFTKTIPRIYASAARIVMLNGLFRPTLIETVVREDLGYRGHCVAKGREHVLDLDRDGWATDLIVTIYPGEKTGNTWTCPSEVDTSRAAHLFLKELSWRGLRPRYAMLHAFSVGLPTSFSTVGPYIIGTTAASHNPAYYIYAYSNGTLHQFGMYRSLADRPANLQIGGRLFMQTYDHFRSFEITPSGEPRTQAMTARDIVLRNNTTVVVEDEDQLADELKAEIGKLRTTQQDAFPIGNYERVASADPACRDLNIFQNGTALRFESKGKKGVCTAELKVAPTAQVVTNTNCLFFGFTGSPQFPWGYIYDEREKEHEIRCRVGDDSDNYGYAIVAVPESE